ncbi:MAG: short-chain dehydrogenase/reductase [Sedimentibacter sp.]|jgi:NAD(P)-dependent dehydrogenase (short-subunit alcohol dehydrogenase family)|nr:short-chain dehydrogenase/reductase [Sedimentibacter sp.]
MIYNKIDYTGKNVVITGAASGMGAEVKKLISELGAEIYALDLKEVDGNIKKFIPINLGDKKSIDEAVALLPERVDCIFHCAGIAGTTYSGKRFDPIDVVKINFIGAKYFVESVIPRMPEGSSIVMVSSIAAMGWRAHIADYMEFVKINDWDQAIQYAIEHMDDPLFMGGPETANKPYTFAKESMIIYMTYRSWDLAGSKIRINTVSPGATKTPMHDDFNEIVGKKRGSMMPVSPAGYEAVPEQMASVMLFLNSDMADYVSGQNIGVDYGMVAGIALKNAKPSPVMNAN